MENAQCACCRRVVAIRDTKRRSDGMHVVGGLAFAALLADVRSGRFDI